MREPRTWTHPDVLTTGVAEGWAEAETDPTRINWPERQARAAIPFEVVDGRPVNPCEKTGIRYGRNEMGRWGEQQMADALVTVTCNDVRHLLMVERDDGYGWAVPGGHVEPGENGWAAAIRELAEETGIVIDPDSTRSIWGMPPRYVPDPRSSDEAWAVTIPVHIDFGSRDELPPVKGGDDARVAAWVPAVDYDRLAAWLGGRAGGMVFAAHRVMLREFLDGDTGRMNAERDDYAAMAAEWIAGQERLAALGLPELPDDPAERAAMRSAGFEVLAECTRVTSGGGAYVVLPAEAADDEMPPAEYLVLAQELAAALSADAGALPGVMFIATMRETPDDGPVLSGFRPLPPAAR